MIRQLNAMNAHVSISMSEYAETKAPTSFESDVRENTWPLRRPVPMTMLMNALLFGIIAAGCCPDFFGASAGGGGFDPVDIQIENISNVQLASGGSVLLVKLDNGTVFGCGNNNSGLLGTGQTGQSRLGLTWMHSPDGGRISGVSQVATQSGQSYVLMDDGSVLAYGSNINGALGHGVEEYLFNGSLEPSGVSVINSDGQPLTEVVQVGAGLSYGLAITSGGQVLSWGSNDNGQLGNGTEEQRAHAAPVIRAGAAVTNARQVAAGNGHALALLDDGTVLAWGRNNWGQLGNGRFVDKVLEPEFVLADEEGNPLSGVAAIDAFGGLSMALMEDGRVLTWGNGRYGQLGDGTSGERNRSRYPREVTGIRNAIAIAAGGSHAMALLDDGTVKSWGINFIGMLGNGETGLDEQGDEIFEPFAVTVLSAEGTPLNRVVRIAASRYNSFALLDDGTVLGWGESLYGQLGSVPDDDTRGEALPVLIIGPDTTTEMN